MKNNWMMTAACASMLLAGSAMAAEGDADKGKDVFEQCGVCHNADSAEKKVGPSLMGLYKKPALKNKKPVTDANVKAVIKAGGNGMPAYDESMVSAKELADLIAYLKTI
jgi:cytochrome c